MINGRLHEAGGCFQVKIGDVQSGLQHTIDLVGSMSLFSGDGIPTTAVLNSFPLHLFRVFDQSSNTTFLSANVTSFEFTTAAVPLLSAIWLLGSALVGLLYLGRSKK